MHPVFDSPIAHRGYHQRDEGVIENSSSAFEAAITNGFAIECDLQLSADSEAVVFHDDTLKRLTGREGFVRDLSAEAVTALPLRESAAGDSPLLFSAFLALIDGRAPLVVELKNQHEAGRNRALAQRACGLVESYAGPLVFKSFHPGLLAEVRKAGFRGEIGIVTFGYDNSEWAGHISPLRRMVLRHLLHYPYSRFTFISCEHTALNLPALGVFRSRGFSVMSWTVRDRATAQAIGRKADQIIFEGFDPTP